MAKDKEILDALKDDKSQRFMAATLGVSRNTAAKSGEWSQYGRCGGHGQR